MKKVLLTGAAGFIGARLAWALSRKGWAVLATGRAPSGGAPGRPLPDSARYVNLDLTDFRAMDAFVSETRPEAIVNAAALGVKVGEGDPRSLFLTNAEAPVRLLAAASRAGAGRFLQIGSCFEYGPSSGPVSEDAPLRPATAYAASKAAGTWSVLAAARALRMPALVVRPFGVWGAGEAGWRLVPQILRAARTGERLALTAGDQVRDFTYVDDVADRIADLLGHERFGEDEVVNVGSGRGIPVREFATAVATIAGCSHLLDFGKLPARTGEAAVLVADVRRQEKYLGRIVETGLSDGLAQILV